MEEQQHTSDDGIHLLEYLEVSSKATTHQAQFCLLTSIAQALGFKFVAYAAISGWELALAPAASALCNYPKHWQIRYDAQDYQRIDPIVLRAPQTRLPLLWRTVKSNGLTQTQTRLFEEAAAAGLVDGVSIPIHGPFDRLAVISFVANAEIEIGDTLIGILNVVAIQFDFAFRSICHDKGNRISLSGREKECLSWVAAGKSSWDISKIVGISENTVNFHIKNSMKKLDCSSRRVAIVKAIRMTLINSPVL